ncbi:3-oxoacyl-ACP reductase [Loigolactobacillus iwatensis]|nr:3-oxoacyl-ACP reductase [Loigolactobacillus iwatensis]
MRTYPDWTQRHIIVTGAASGIGLAQVKLLLKLGVHVYAIDQQDNASFQSLQHKCPQQLTYYRCDLRLESELQRTVQQILRTGYIDSLFNTAGILDHYATTLATTSQDWDNVMLTNLKSQFLLTNQVLPQMLKHQFGVFVNMASIAGLVAGGGGAAYTAAKHAIIGYTKQLDYNYAAAGIQANCIAPGAIDTPMNQADFTGAGTMAKSVAEQTPAKRWAKPEEVANLSRFLASPEADYIHGTVIPIDGGWLEK